MRAMALKESMVVEGIVMLEVWDDETGD